MQYLAIAVFVAAVSVISWACAFGCVQVSASTATSLSSSAVAQQASTLYSLAGNAPAQLSESSKQAALVLVQTLSSHVTAQDVGTASVLLNTMASLTEDSIAQAASLLQFKPSRRLLRREFDVQLSRHQRRLANATSLAQSLLGQMNGAIHSLSTGVLSSAFPGEAPTSIPVSTLPYN